MKKIRILLAAVLFVLTFISCDPNESNSTQNDDPFAQNFGNMVSRDFIGRVANHLDQPIDNALVTIGTSTAHTDKNGVFIIHGASVYEKFAYITATKAGYMDSSHSLIPTTGKNFVRMQMDSTDSNMNLTIQSGVPSQIGDPPLESFINFDGAFEDSNGNAYSGTVNVNFNYFTPQYSSEEYFPGMLYGKREDGSQASLNGVAGLLKAELKGSAGQPLDIANGHTAQISILIPIYGLASAPATIPLWYFDKEAGYWKEEGLATKVGSYYVGTISHLALWACSTASPSVRLTFRMVDQNGIALSNVPIQLGNLYDFYDEGITDENGRFTGLLPAGQLITIKVGADGGNEATYYTASIGPYNSDANVPPITLDSSTHITGTLLKCNNANVTNGYVAIRKWGMLTITEVNNGSFDLNEIYNPSDTVFRIKGVDYDNALESDVIISNFIAPVTNVGTLNTCTSLDEFFRYQIDTNPQVNLTNIHTRMEFGLNVSATIQSGIWTNESMIINLPTAIGTYSTSTCSIQCDDTGEINSTTQNTMQFNVTAFGEVGGFVDVNFSGTYHDSNNVPHTLSGQAHVRRDE